MEKNYTSNQKLYKRAKEIIPGGTQLLSKRPEMFLPEYWPTYYTNAKGVYVEDLEGNTYLDMSYSGIGACTLGYADPDVNAAVVDAIHQGSMATLNCPEEVELAELLCDLHPWADMARFARCGGEAMMISVRVARAHTKRDKIVFCGYHGWNDWYLACNLREANALEGHLLSGLDPSGVPKGLTGTAIPFSYNNIDELEKIVKDNKEEIAAIVMEPQRGDAPKSGFLESVREIASRIGAVLIFDEVTSGWRMNTGGIHLTYNVNPDIAVFAKGMSNGYPMSAIIGVADVMRSAQDTFISSTYWTERVGSVAALATIKKHRDFDVGSHLNKIGRQVQSGWKILAKEKKLNISLSGIPPLSHFSFQYDDALVINTLFCQEMLKRGILAKNAFYANFAHKPAHVERYLRAVDEVFDIIVAAIASKNISAYLDGGVAHAGFQRLT